MRADRAERELAALKEKAVGTKICNLFQTGACTYGNACRFSHIESTELLKRRLVEKEAELERARAFSSVRSAMIHEVRSVKADFKQLLQNASCLDLVVVMDCTGSMSAWIAEAQRSIVGILDSIKGLHSEAAIRVGFVGYRDHCDGRDRLVVKQLTDQVGEVKTCIQAQRAFGGGDTPEDVAGGLQAALEMQWAGGARCIILVGDAPCHGSEFHDYGAGGDSPDSLAHAATDPDIKGQMRAMVAAGIDFTVIEVQPAATSKMVAILQSVYNAALSTAEDGGRVFSRTPLASAGDTTKFVPTVVSAADASITASKSRSVFSLSRAVGVAKVSSVHHYGPTGDKRRPTLGCIAEEGTVDVRPTSLVKGPIDWVKVEHRPVERAVRYTYLFRPKEEVNWTAPDLKLVSQVTQVKIDPNYFADGSMRTAHAMKDMNIGKRFVAKVYKRSALQCKAVVARDTLAQAVAKKIAHVYSVQNNVPTAVDFLFTSFYELIDRPKNDPLRWFGAEPFIAGTYKKYNSNNGWQSKEFSETAMAFSHYSWQYTNGKLMVVDLQGVNYILTDPQIHTHGDGGEQFGEGNLGTRGIAAFFATHECNDICRQLDLVPLSSGTAKIGKGAVALHRKGSSLAEALDAPMEVSCALCGSIFSIGRKMFVDQHNHGQQPHCSECTEKVAKRQTYKCSLCPRDIMYSPYWYVMTGMERPKSCKDCKAAAKG